MTAPARARGDLAEDRALSYLLDAGLELIARNVASPLGEIDLIMRDGRQWVFVEVRSRSSAAFGGAAASVTRAKPGLQYPLRLTLQTQWVLKSRFGDTPWPACRFDVCALDAGQINWIQGAF